MDETTWAGLFEWAARFDASEADVRDVLAARRGGDDGGAARED